ncbi:MAG: hypothetical protein LUE98_00905 [Tannerellaceae bacterium]|nr:hypothetical protein [Tannerellaceae bacterium]
MKNEKKLVKKIRLWVVFFILALVGSGITAFPIEWGLGILSRIMNISPAVPADTYTGMHHWLAFAYQGVLQTNATYPFIFYGTDWLAFAHLVIAVAFMGVYFRPVRNKWIIHWAMIACVGIIPLAFICGSIRGIPFYWQLIDCSFGVFGIIPLLLLNKYIKQLQSAAGIPDFRY